MTNRRRGESSAKELAPLAPVPPLPNDESSANGSAQSDPVDPFDPAALRASAAADVQVERVLTAVPVRKPGRNEFFRVNGHKEFELDTFIVEREDGMDRQAYLVLPAMQEQLSEELRLVRLFTCISRRGTVFLWPCKLPRDDTSVGRRWAETALMAADRARGCWVRMVGDRDLGGYALHVAKGDLGEPQWPDKSFRELIAIAFRDNVIDRPDHPVIRELNGEI